MGSNSIRRFTRNILALVAQAAALRVFGLITNIFLARSLGPGMFGIFAAVLGTASSGFQLVKLGIDAAIHVNLAHDLAAGAKDRAGRVIGAGGLLFLFAAVVGMTTCMALAAWLAIHVYGHPGIAQWLMVAGILVVGQCASQYLYSILAGANSFDQYAYVTTIGAAVTLVLTIVGLHFWGLGGAIAATVLGSAVSVILLARKTRAFVLASDLRFALQGALGTALELLRYGMPLYLSALIAVPIVYLAQGMLARWGGLEALGQVRAALAVAAIVGFVPASLAPAIISRLIDTRVEGGGDERPFVSQSWMNVRLVWILTLALAAIVSALAPLLIVGLFGRKYAGSIFVVAILSHGAVMSAVMAAMSQSFQALRMSRPIFVQNLLAAATYLAGLASLIPEYLVPGYALTEVLAYSVGCLPFLVGSARIARSEKNLAATGGLFVLTLGFALCAFALGNAQLPPWTVSVAAAIELLLLMVVIPSAVMTRQEIRTVLATIGGSIGRLKRSPGE